jgi:hypothetical protein
MMKFLFSAIAALFLLAPYSAEADTGRLDKQLRNHTFVYIDKNTNLEHTIYFGRFGKVYDEYYSHIYQKDYPCQFVDGTWRITKQGRLCLEDSEDKNRRDGKTCLLPKIEGEKISFTDDVGKIAFETKLTKGNGMPLG